MFSKILIANRGDIALRVLRACKELGVKTVAVHSLVDEALMHVKFADESVCIGPNKSADSYLNTTAILGAAELTGVDAIHPGVGFLSENAKFASIIKAHGITFIGPSPEHILTMGEKVLAKKTMQRLGVPVVRGSDSAIQEVEEAISFAEEVGYPVLFKATAGGGGKGMKIAATRSEILPAFQMAKAEAKSNFGNEDVYIEKYLSHPRHIEFQIISDSFGNVVHLGERDCSIQRNHQKLLEEAPSPVLTNDQRDRIGKIVTKAIAEIGYVGVGTLEFLFEDGEFLFMEMNTRLQVEHPISEEISGIDIVQEQIKIAAGEKLSFSQEDINISGHAIEFRINAENSKTFLPSPGVIQELHFPGGKGIRVDSHIYREYNVPPYYDSLIAKLIVFDKTREACLKKARRALDEFMIEGIDTTIDLHKKFVRNQDIIRGEYNIHWLRNSIGEL
jgi:acetyl-CoA carboxylase biotin carboxylase subunit